MNKLETLKKEYARLVVRSGINIQKGQRLAVTCPVECADFARLLAKEAYEAGCREVIMRWTDDTLTRYKYLYAEDSVFDEFAVWEKELCDILSEEGAGWIAIHAEDPENLKGVDADRIRRGQMSRGKALEKFRDRETRNEFPWCVCSIPCKAWNRAVFPDLSEEEAEEKLWEEILAACRVKEEGTMEAWKQHSDELHRHVEMLNEYDFRYLKYKNSAGTDVTVELPEGHFWAGGEELSKAGAAFSANIPTEEVFTLPKRDGINGKLVATKPLSLNGTLIKDFFFIIENGKIVEAHAAEGEKVLKDAITVDEGASYFGEVALVPFDSPISNSGILFYNTLFDENASCHFAFGDAYPCIKGAENMTEEELLEAGVNASMTHVDFMVGSRDLSITGVTKEGKEVEVFRNGNFVF